MPDYRRAFIPGGSWFFTVNLLERRKTLLVDHVATLQHAVEGTRRSFPFTIDAFVVLPDHLHAIWTLPPGDADFSTHWRLIKTRFARGLPRQERLSTVRVARNERGIWQRRLGTPDPRRRRLRPTRNVLLHQSDQAWSGRSRQRLAAFVISS
jgi:putative transposase